MAKESSTDNKPKRGCLSRALKVIGALLAVFVVAAVGLLAMAWVPMGKAPEGQRLEQMKASPNWRDGIFVNPQPMFNDVGGWFTSISEASDHASPDKPVKVEENSEKLLAVPFEGARVTWLGHSTVLIEIGGKKILTDPVFGPSTAPIAALGPQRWYPAPVPLEKLSDVDIVLISHDHYDHLDQYTIEKMVDWKTTFIAPLGVGAHLEYWGIAPDRIIEVDWWDEHDLGNVRIAATPARHASGRQVLDQNRTLWAGYAIIGPEHRIMFSGDTGMFDDLTTIGDKYGPFDLVMIEVGAYHRTWPDWHIGPEQAIVAHQMLNGEVFMPIHWGLFDLALHGWTEPVERTLAAAEKAGERVTVPKAGQPFQIDSPPAPIRWWPEIPWQTAEEHPIVSTKGGDPNDRYDVVLAPRD